MVNAKLKCKCHKVYKPRDDLIKTPKGNFCSYEDATQWGYANKSKGKAIRVKANKKAVRDLDKTSLKFQHKLTQPVFNKLRRLQEFKWFSDRGLEPVCISCGKILGNDQWCNGHFKSVGSNGRLRYDFLNSYLQHNQHCNMQLSGDIKRYEPGLITRFGEEEGNKIIAYCEENNAPIKYTWQEIEALRFSFNKQIKELNQ